MKGALAVLGTDTGVGKTVVTAALAIALRRAGMRVSVMKPVASGGTLRTGRIVSGDAIWLRRILGLADPLEDINPVCYRHALAPAVAAALEGKRTDFAAVRRAFDRLRRGQGILLVEGVGGVLVPLGAGMTPASLCVRLGIPAVVVGRAGLGGINHAWLTVEALRRRGVRVAGVILNGARGGLAERNNPAAIEKYARCPVLAILPRVPRIRSSRRALSRMAAAFPRRSLKMIARSGGWS